MISKKCIHENGFVLLLLQKCSTENTQHSLVGTACLTETSDVSERTMRWLRILQRQRNRFQRREGQINRCTYEGLCELQELLKKKELQEIVISEMEAGMKKRERALTVICVLHSLVSYTTRPCTAFQNLPAEGSFSSLQWLEILFTFSFSPLCI